LLGTPAAWAQEDPEPTQLAFQIYDTQAVAAIVQDVRDHIEAERWAEALTGLETLLNDHRGETLGEQRKTFPAEPWRTSLQAVHEGAARWATRTLLALPRAARDRYQDRHGAQASRALEQALARGDSAGLSHVVQRWPGTRQAVSAWWALGDLEIERGERRLGLQAWWRGLALELGQTHPPRSLSSREPEAWEQALEALRSDAEGGVLDRGIELRVQFALDHLAAGSDAPGADSGLTSVLGSELGGLGVTALTHRRGAPDAGPALDSWTQPYVLATDATHPFKHRTTGKFSLYPTRLDDALFFSTSRRVQAVDALTGEELWRAPAGGLGWDDLSASAAAAYEEAIALRDSLIMPVASRGIVVAPLQIPRVFEAKDTFGRLQIIRIVPERRLFAFDAASGETLWDHAPPPLWDGESGSFQHRMSVVGPAVTSGSRLLVPCAMLRGRIELHLACYDLHSGNLLWNAPLVTGQRPINMFGRLLQEFAAPPPVVVGDRVLMQTQLGALCSLDLFTGDVYWKSLYKQIPFTPGTYYSEGELRSLWRNTPPIVVDQTVVATPFDCPNMLGVDLESGTVLWEATHTELNAQAGVTTGRGKLDALVGAQGDRVYLAGTKIAAFQAPRGLDRQAPLHRVWLYPPIQSRSRSSAFPVMTGNRIYVQGLRDIDCLDLESGQLLETIQTDSQPGNLLVEPGMLFNLTTYGLNAHFEWDHLLGEARKRSEESPGDPEPRHALARLLLSRGQAAMSDQDFDLAARFLADARDELLSLSQADTEPIASKYRASLYEVLMTQARTERLAADPLRAMRFLREALPLAPGSAQQRKTLLEQQAILRGRHPSEWLEVLAVLERDHATEGIRVVAPEGNLAAPEWNGRLIVVESSLANQDEQPRPLLIPVGLWVAVERSQAAMPAGSNQELTDLHHILRYYSTLQLPSGSAWAWAADRIGERVRNGAGPEYAPFERRAQMLLDRAKLDADRHDLERVTRLFPHSRAARQASNERITLVRAAGDVAELADIILTPLGDNWSPVRASKTQLESLLQLAQEMGEQGNLELRAAWLRSLARHHPNASVDLPGQGPRELRQLLGEPGWNAPEREASPVLDATFDSSVELVADPSYTSTKPFLPMGHVPASLAPLSKQDGPRADVVNLYCDGSRLYAISDTSAPHTLWRQFFDRANGRAAEALPSRYEDAVATSPGRVHVASIGSVSTFDRETGETLWSWASGSLRVFALDCISGVVVVHENTMDFNGRINFRLTGLDAATGAKLWSFRYDGGRYHERPVLGEEHLVLLPASSGTGRIFDLFTGRHSGQFQLNLSTYPTSLAAWIEDGRLILPNFLRGTRPAQNHILALDLDSGEQAWLVTFSGGPSGEMELLGILSHAGQHYVHLSPLDTSARSLQQAGLFELNTSLGALANRPLARLGGQDRLVGLESRTRTVLETPYVFVMRIPDSARREPRLSAVHLPHGERWSTPLPESALDARSTMPLPAVSGSTVALAYKKRTGAPGTQGRGASLLFLDRRSGRIQATKSMSPNIWRSTASGLHFSVLDDALIISGALKLDFMR